MASASNTSATDPRVTGNSQIDTSGAVPSANDASSTNPSAAKPPAIPQPLDVDLGEELVSIFVGAKRKKFVVHKKLVCEGSDFFKKTFTGDFKEAQSGELYMSDDKPEAVTLLINWLYKSKIPITNTESHLHDLYELYFLAEKLCLVELKDKTMDTIQDMAVKYDLMDELISQELVKQVLGKTREKYQGLRLFCINMMIYVFLRRWRDDPGEEDVSGDEDNTEDENSTEDENEDTSDDSRLFIKAKDLRAVHQLSQKDFRFFDNFIFRLSQELQRLGSRRDRGLSDARRRIEEDPAEHCFYHCHKKSSKCRPQPTAEAEEGVSFVRNKK